MRSALRHHWLVLVLPVVLLFCGAAPAGADSPALGFTAISELNSGGDFIIGWEFNVLSPVEVTALGLLDGNGLSADGQAVGVWDPTGNLLASTTVFPSDPLSGTFFRFKDLLSPVTLPVGVGYRVAAVYPNGRFYGYDPYGPPTGWTVDPRISWMKDCWLSATNLEYPANSTGGLYAGFGGNMMLKNGDPVPEPALIQLPFLLGLGGLGAWWRRRKTV